MRVEFLRATTVTLMAALFGSTAAWPALAQDMRPPLQAPRQSARLSLPDGADEGAAAQRMILPPPPLADVTLGPDVTGSLAPRAATEAALDRSRVPAALPYDDPPGIDPAFSAAPTPAPAPAAPAPAAALPAPAAPTTVARPADAAPPAAAATPASPAVAPDVAVAPLAPPSDHPLPPATAAAPAAAPNPDAQSPDAATLGAALARFTSERPAGDSPAQATDRRSQREAIAAVYASRANAPLWIADGHLTPAARAVLARLDHAAEDGLDVSRFAVPVPRDAAPDTLAAADLAVSEAAVAYARQATGARVDVARIGLIDLRPDVADAARVLGTLPQAADAGEALRAFNPPQPGYGALRDKLAELRHHADDAQSRIPPGPALKVGMSDARVPLIRARFGLDVAADDPDSPRLVYDTRVAAAVAAFQRTHGLRASGILTPQTIAALSGGEPARLEADIVANMELWRWLPRDLGPDRVEVNIPDYTARVVRDGAVEHETRVVVGQPDKPTPVFAEQMKFIIVNPYWNVPLSIINKEMMPKLAGDPNYFADHGYEVVERDGITYVRQPPGDGNALGRIKFMFPNKHSVYLHDTNARSFFSRDKRALSHGCVRVEQPFSFAEAVMGKGNGWSEARIRKLIGGQERTINLPRPLPIFITYFTAFVDPQTGFQLRDDVYGYTGKVKAALGLPG